MKKGEGEITEEKREHYLWMILESKVCVFFPIVILLFGKQEKSIFFHSRCALKNKNCIHPPCFFSPLIRLPKFREWKKRNYTFVPKTFLTSIVNYYLSYVLATTTTYKCCRMNFRTWYEQNTWWHDIDYIKRISGNNQRITSGPCYMHLQFFCVIENCPFLKNPSFYMRIH